MAELIVIIHVGRCGSTVLGDLLNQSPHVQWEREIFTNASRNPMPIDDGAILWRKLLDERRRRSRKPHVGIEVKTNQILYQKARDGKLPISIDELCDIAKGPVIYLYRENHIDRMVSGISAMQTGHYVHVQGREVPPPVSVQFPRIVTDWSYAIEKQDIRDWLNRAEEKHLAIAEHIKARGGVVIAYETHAESDPAAGCMDILERFDIPPHTPSLRFNKVDPRSTLEKIENLEELRDWLTPNQVERYLG